MAYLDQNGLVAIDENEAFDDVSKLKTVVDSMNETLDLLKEIQSINSSAKGDTNIMVDTATTELNSVVSKQIAEIELLINQINEVVEKYRAIDESIKNQINTSMN